MYESFYGLKDKPFSMLPDPGFLYLSKKHQAALTMLEYALYNNAGFCVISGDIGAGKTTLLRKLLQSMEKNVTVGMITNTHQSFGELLDWVLAAFNIHKPGLNKVEMHQVFTDFLMQQYAQQKTALLIVDEAQNMDVKTLEELRMLSNINSEKDQLLQVILAGQPELKETLRRPEMRQFVQRIAVDYHLGPLNLEETYGYIQHRLITAGARRNVFTPLASQRIHEYSGGIPRLINLLCDTAMVYGFADQVKLIGENLVDEMVRERMADSLVPILRNAPPAAEKPAAKKTPRAAASKSPVNPHLAKISPESRPKSIPPAEKKTPAKTLKSVAHKVHKTAQGAAVSNAKAAEFIDEEIAASQEIIARSQPQEDEVAQTDSVADPVADSDDAEQSETQLEPQKSLFDFEAALKVDADKHAARAEIKPSVKAPVQATAPRKQGENSIEMLPSPQIKSASLFGKWTIIAFAAVIIVALFLYLREQNDYPASAEVSRPVTAPIPAPAQQPEAEPVPENLQLQQEENARLRNELEQLQEQEKARREQSEAEAKALQLQRDQAVLQAEQEKRERLKKAEEAKIAASKARLLEAKQKKIDAEQAAARARELEALEAKRQQLEVENKAAAERDMKLQIEREERRARELELEWRKAQQQVAPAPAPAPAPADAPASWQTPASGQNNASDGESTAKKNSGDGPSPEFVMDPCQGPSARFLSTCR